MLLDGYAGQLLQGLLVTLEIACSAFILGLVLAISIYLAQISQYKMLRLVIRSLTSLIRGLPELLTLFAIYFGGTLLLQSWFGSAYQMSAFIAGVIALSLIFAAYCVQVIRGAFMAIPPGQAEAAFAIGLTHWQTFKRVLLPQAIRHALPGLGNLWLVLLKDSALVSLIGLGDLLNKAQLAANSTRQPFEFYVSAALIFLGLTTLSQIMLSRVNKHVNKHV